MKYQRVEGTELSHRYEISYFTEEMRQWMVKLNGKNRLCAVSVDYVYFRHQEDLTTFILTFRL